MAWKPVIESGDRVTTPFGMGRVQQVAGDGSARVDVDGQLYQVQGGDMTKVGQEGEGTPAPEVEEKFSGDTVREGDRVRNKATGKTGKVDRVTQRTVYVEYDGGEKKPTRPYTKKDIHNTFEREYAAPRPEEKDPEQKRQEERKERTTETQAKDTAEDLFGLLQLKKHLEEKIDTSVDGELKELRDLAKRNQKLEVKVGDKVNIVEGLKHKQLEQLISYALLRISPLLVGMAGTGKTHAAEQVATALSLPFFSISVGAQTTKTDIMGYTDANGRYVRTHFREAYENGGVFLMDEIDAGNANVLITINAALSNGLAAFPDMMVKKHDDFVFIASANTFGNGANRQYVGRNQLDAATLDRFAILEWLIDEDLEESLSHGLNGKAWYMAVKASREYVAEKKIRALISPRATQKGCKLLDIGQPLEEVIDATMLGSVPDDKKTNIKAIATKIFEKFASGVPKELPKDVDPPTAEDLVKPAVFENIPF